MSITSIHDNTIDLTRPSAGEKPQENKPRRWWNALGRGGRRPWFRSRAIEDLRDEQHRLIETIESLQERLVGKDSQVHNGLSPMPVFQDLSEGQRELNVGIARLNGHMERSTATDERLAQAVTKVDATLTEVRGSQTQTVEAIDGVAKRFEEIVERMAEAEKTLSADYKKLQNRSMLCFAGVSGMVLVVLGFFMMTQ